MERMAGGQDSWARWKSVVLALPQTQSRFARLLNGEDAIIAPADWDVTAQSQAALARYEAWEKRFAVAGDEAAMLDYQGARAAALSHQHDLATDTEPKKVEDS